MRPLRSENLVYVTMALFLGVLLTYNKLSNDVVPLSALTKVCSDEIEHIKIDRASRGFFKKRNYEKTRLLTVGYGEAVLHGNSPGYAAASRVVVLGSSYCIYFDPSGRTRTVYEVISSDRVLMRYADVADHRRANIDGVFWVGIFLIFVVAPCLFLISVRQNNKPVPPFR